jgi:hypothetical protein
MVNNLLNRPCHSQRKKLFDGTHEKIMFCVFENHIDRFVLQNNFLEGHYILVRYFSVQLMELRFNYGEWNDP